MAVCDRDWAKAPLVNIFDPEATAPPGQTSERKLEGMFPTPIRPNGAPASLVALVDLARGKVAEFVTGCKVASFEDAAMLTEVVNKLIIATHNARHEENEGVEDDNDGPAEES